MPSRRTYSFIKDIFIDHLLIIDLPRTYSTIMSLINCTEHWLGNADRGRKHRFFPQQRRLDVFGGGRGFAQDVFKLRRYIEKKV